MKQLSLFPQEEESSQQEEALPSSPDEIKDLTLKQLNGEERVLRLRKFISSIEKEALQGKFHNWNFTREQLQSFDYIIIAFSGGKDSLALILRILTLLGRLGRDVENVTPRIEIVHHDVDGIYYKWRQKYDPCDRHDNHDLLMQAEPFFDWPFTIPYVRAVCGFLNLPLYVSWREGGIKKELFKQNARSGDIYYETPEGLFYRKVKGKPNTRLKFPALGGDLRTRWCTPTVKIEAGRTWITKQKRFQGKKLLFLTGERAEESRNRAKYYKREPHVTHCKSRSVTHWRSLLRCTTEQVWETIANAGIVPAPSYFWGFGRCSCQTCIFIGNEDWATLRQYYPEKVQEIASIEKSLRTDTYGGTIEQPKKGQIGKTVWERSLLAKPRTVEAFWILRALSDAPWTQPICFPSEKWVLPQGAFGDMSSGSL